MTSLTVPTHVEWRPDGPRLRELREQHNLTRKLAAALLDMDERTLDLYEQDKAGSKFEYNRLRKFANLYGVSTDSLVTAATSASLQKAPRHRLKQRAS